MKNKLPFSLLILIIGISLSCSDEASDVNEDITEPGISTLYFPPTDSDTWETQSVTELDWDIDSEQPLYDFLEEKGTKAFIILKNGKIVIEKYFNGATISDNHPWYSAGKTLTAFTTGIAQQEGFLDINNPSAIYLGNDWANITPDQETTITVRNHLTMTTGLDYNVLNQNCTDFECLTYLNSSGSFWYYHNATYTLLTNIITEAVQMDYNTYFESKLKSKIGMNGSWIQLGFANIYYSTARSMARFGLLNLNKGIWNTTEIMTDQDYFNEMTSSSQNLNPAYGYLWWLNGTTNFRAPAFEIEFEGELMPDAPDDLIAGLGKNDQKLYVIPSQNLVIVRMGNDTGEALLGPSSFDNELWKKINLLIN
ncbi:serine hydrolase domain-containing protein [Aquimarina sp. 2201CG5-10]|uniref:serine hydrolase domain-containing protein n=1 Tax=Aquimarina callyspongiae TaxID=3098150 RepID=UPI002AB46F95|nr:serine hydrolase domain-containing protein [Aquimarina sp. 2201CG5-10]MDY8134062.1 serine hydrolase domain-containing protein [Aquimarina sp. 2201CG5-10]